MRYPREEEYQDVVQHPSNHFFDTELKKCDFERRLWGPRGYSGRTTITFHLFNTKNHWAVRCFKREIPDLEKRYSALGNFVMKKKPDFFVQTECLKNGVLVKGISYPIIKMEWVNGLTLDQFLKTNYSNSEILHDLANQFCEIVRYMELEKIAHGDLQHGNILVKDGKLKLIDYDGVFLQEIFHLGSSDAGHPNYQHPDRDETQFNYFIDRFSAIVIYLGLFALANNPTLFNTYHNGENIIFKEGDFKDPKKSSLFKMLLNQDTTESLCKNFLDICKSPMSLIPSLDEFIHSSYVVSSLPDAIKVQKPVDIISIPDSPDSKTKDRDFTRKRAKQLKIEKINPLLKEQKKYQERITYYLQLLEDSPNNVEYLIPLAESYYNIGNYSESLDIYKKIKNIHPKAHPRIDDEIESSSIQLAEQKKKYEKIIVHCLELLKNYPNSVKQMIPLAESYYNLGKYSEALEVFERIKKIDPTKYPRIDEMIESSKSLINTEMEGN